MKKQVLLLLSIAFISSAAFAQTNTFTGGTNTAWEEDTNWSEGTAPVAGQQVEFAADAAAIVTTVTTVGKFKYGTQAGTNLVTVQSGGSLTFDSGGWSSVGWSGNATANLTIEAGGTVDFGPTHMWAAWSDGTHSVVDVAGTLICLDGNAGFGWEAGNQANGTGGVIIRTTGVVNTRNFDNNLGDDGVVGTADDRRYLNGAGFTFNIEGDGLLTIVGDKTAEVAAYIASSQLYMDSTPDPSGALVVNRYSSETNLTYVYNLGGSGAHDTLGVKDYETLTFNMYPNPTSNMINIESQTRISNVKLYNQLGQMVLEVNDKANVDISKLSAGLYIVKAEDVEGNLGTRRVVKQ